MPRLTADKLRAVAEWELEIDPGVTVLMRRVDMVTAYMLGTLNLPLMAALGRLVQQAPRMANDPSAMAEYSDEDKAQMIELMRRYACAAIKDPIFVLSPDGDPKHCDVTLLTSAQLLAIWASKPPGEQKDAEDADREVSAAKAATFRSRKKPSRAPRPDGETVSSAPVSVPGPGVVDFVYG